MGMLKLATILQNPGEPTIHSRYNDPSQLRQLGYNGLVLYETTGLSGVANPDEISDDEMRRWVKRQLDDVCQQINRARHADLSVYIFYDVLSLSHEVADRGGTAVSCINRPVHLCPGSDRTIELCRQGLLGLLDLLPSVDGVVIRFGDNAAGNLPHLVGNEIYSPRCGRCAALSRADRIIKAVTAFHDLVVTQLEKRLIVRAWNVAPDGLHDSVRLCQEVAKRLPGPAGDDRFVLSFKFTHTDFWRYQRWNPCSLVFADRPIVYELQCQREFEGKGAMPNWQAPLWRNEASEIADLDDQQPTEKQDLETGDDRRRGGLAQVTQQINWAGLWAWVRGGGWGGPFIKNETWIDANVFAAVRLADRPDIDCDQLAQAWINERLAVDQPATVEILKNVLAHSTRIVLQSFYIHPLARSCRDPWNPNDGWIQDDLVDVQATWGIVQRLADSDLDEVIREKQHAVEQIASDRIALQNLINDEPHSPLQQLVNSLIYTESLIASLRSLLAGLVAYRRYLANDRDPAQAKLCQRWLTSAQSHWSHHTQRHGSLPGVPTAFREIHFWELTQQILNEINQPATN